MPRISAFYGIIIWLYWNDHQPPHFHAEYAGQVALVAIADSTVIRGSLPPRALRLVEEWAGLHRTELAENWERAQRREALVSIEPLP